MLVMANFAEARADGRWRGAAIVAHLHFIAWLDQAPLY
jgi:hypothetical protein